MTLVVHPSISKDPRFEILPHSYQFNNVKEEWLATLLLEQSDVFAKLPQTAHRDLSLRRRARPLPQKRQTGR